MYVECLLHPMIPRVNCAVFQTGPLITRATSVEGNLGPVVLAHTRLSRSDKRWSSVALTLSGTGRHSADTSVRLSGQRRPRMRALAPH